MCGIAGFITPRTETNGTEAIQAMVAALRHRGPDGNGQWCADIGDYQLALGHTRLTILDLSDNAQQPMIDPVTGCVLIYNGEIYNFHEIRHELLRNGERPFKSTGDTEVLLRAYIHWGPEFVKKLRGMFAFGVYDPRSRRLVLGRDHLGIKPLYFTYDGHGHFAFASEVRGLLKLGWINRRLDPLGLVSYLAYGSVQGPSTLVSGVQSLLPGHMMTVDLSGEAVAAGEPESFWTLPTALVDAHLSYSDTIIRVKEALAESVRLHLVSDVPLGVFLSGGVDSSSVVALMAQLAPEQLHTLTVAFDESEYDESRIAQSVARHYGAKHTEVRLSARNFLSQLSTWLSSFDQPSADGANTWIISQACRQAGIKVALSGLGADELFAGYSTFGRARQANEWFKRLAWIPQSARTRLADLLRAGGRKSIMSLKVADWLVSDGSTLATYLLLRRLFLNPMCRELLDDRILQATNGYGLPPSILGTLTRQAEGADTTAAVSLLEMNTYLVNTLLRDSDQMGMAHSLEVRVPFVDWKLAEVILSLPGSVRIQGSPPKPLLRAAMDGKLSAAWTERPKMGFTIPFDDWLRGDLRGVIEEGLANLSGFPFRPGAVAALWQQFLSGSRHVHSGRILVLYTLAHWMRENQMEYGA